MSPSAKGPRALRMKPIAAGLAVVFAAGIFCLPLDSSATPGSQAWRAVSAAQREQMQPLRQQQRALHLEMVQSRLSGDAGALMALRGEIKALRQQIRAKAAPAASGNNMGSLRDRLAAHPEVLAQMRAHAKAQRTQRLAAVQARLGATPQASGVQPKALITVSNCNDAGAGSLRDAVGAAATGDTIDMTALACSTITLSTGSIVIGQDDLTIAGPGAGALAIDALGNSTVFDFIGTGALAVNDVTVTRGYYGGGAPGGAIWSYDGDITLQDSVISNSEVYDAGGAAAYTAYGDITLTRSTVSGNEAYAYFVATGALTSKYGNVGMIESTVTSNQTDAYYLTLGGGVYANGVAAVVQSTVSQNSATGSVYGAWAGGVYGQGSAYIIESTISGNHADSNGGGFTTTNLGMANSTVSGNDSGAYAGGGSVFDGQAALTSSTITGNSAGAAVGGLWITDTTVAKLNSTILFGNTESSPSVYGADLGSYGGATVDPAYGNNLVGNTFVVVPVGTLTADPLLGPLANNGGPTLTHALGAGSPAIDTGNNIPNFATDQRGVGFDRVSGAAADIGAFEVQQLTLSEPPRLVPATSVWGLGLLGTLLGFLGWRQGWFASSSRRRS